MPQLNINAQDIIDMHGAYYIDQGQNASMIRTLYRENFATKNQFTTVETNDTILRNYSAEFNEVIQPFNKKWSPKGGFAFKAKDIPLYQIKVDLEVYPDVLVRSWLGFLASNNVDRTTWPLIKYIEEVYVYRQIQEDLETKAIFGGKYVAPVDGTPSAAADSMNGIKEVLNAKITAGDITTIATGAPSTTPATWTGQLETFLESIPEHYRGQVQDINTSEVLMRRHRKGNRALYNTAFEGMNRDELNSFIDYPSTKVVGLPSHVGTKKIWTTVPGNAILALKANANQSVIEVEKVDRMVKLYTDFWIGVGFIFDELVWTNDQDLT